MCATPSHNSPKFPLHQTCQHSTWSVHHHDRRCHAKTFRPFDRRHQRPTTRMRASSERCQRRISQFSWLLMDFIKKFVSGRRRTTRSSLQLSEWLCWWQDFPSSFTRTRRAASENSSQRQNLSPKRRKMSPDWPRLSPESALTRELERTYCKFVREFRQLELNLRFCRLLRRLCWVSWMPVGHISFKF